MAPQPTHIISCQDNATEAQKAAVEKYIKEQGGQIVDTFKYGGFSVIFSADKVGTLESHPDIKTVETNGEMKIQ